MNINLNSNFVPNCIDRAHNLHFSYVTVIYTVHLINIRSVVPKVDTLNEHKLLYETNKKLGIEKTSLEGTQNRSFYKLHVNHVKVQGKCIIIIVSVTVRKQSWNNGGNCMRDSRSKF